VHLYKVDFALGSTLGFDVFDGSKAFLGNALNGFRRNHVHGRLVILRSIPSGVATGGNSQHDLAQAFDCGFGIERRVVCQQVAFGGYQWINPVQKRFDGRKLVEPELFVLENRID